MLAGLTAFLIALIIFVMATLGCVLLVAFTMRKSSARARITVAALAGPGVMIVPIMLLAATDGASGGLVRAGSRCVRTHEGAAFLACKMASTITSTTGAQNL